MSSKHILIIDNRVKTRGAMSQLFEDLGCEIMTTRDEATGLAAAQCGEFDLVVLGSDPHTTVDGRLLQALKEHNPDMMVLMLGGNGSTPSPQPSLRSDSIFAENATAPGDGVTALAGLSLLQDSPSGDGVAEPPSDPRAPYPVQSSLRDVEKIHIERVLEHKGWNQSAAAQALGIDRKTLRNKMREFRLDRAE